MLIPISNYSEFKKISVILLEEKKSNCNLKKNLNKMTEKFVYRCKSLIFAFEQNQEISY